MFNSISATMIAAHDEFVSLDVALCVNAPPDAIACIEGEQSVGRMFYFSERCHRTYLSVTEKMGGGESTV